MLLLLGENSESFFCRIIWLNLVNFVCLNKVTNVQYFTIAAIAPNVAEKNSFMHGL